LKLILIIISVVFAGVPFGQGVGFLKDIHVGESVGLNSKILGPDVLFSCPSIFTFFPPSSLQRIVDSDKNEIFMDFFDADCWQKQELSVFSSQ
jgi:hypothetical protein